MTQKKPEIIILTEWSQIDLLGYLGLGEQFILCQASYVGNVLALSDLLHDGWPSLTFTYAVFSWSCLVTRRLAQWWPVCSVTSAVHYSLITRAGLCYPSNLLLEYSVSTLASTRLLTGVFNVFTGVQHFTSPGQPMTSPWYECLTSDVHLVNYANMWSEGKICHIY